jgi:hypothetical protein
MRVIPGKAKTVHELLKGVQIAERIWNPADLLKGGQP